ncbi:MAG: dihydrofolate reductase [Lachnospiraceae bacterium]|nr:dihydrofolate reductase [Lachnospiraceae bacterium]
MKAILSADKNWGIGNKGDLLIHIPSDMKYFREQTTGHVVIMGRKTLESFPGGQPLPKRTNVVLTRDRSYKGPAGVVVVHSVEELLSLYSDWDTNDLYVIGGGMIYKELLPYCDTVYVTKIDFAYQADTFFPNLDELPEWKCVWESDEQTCFDIEFAFTRYERIAAPSEGSEKTV